jgi:membrane protease YdiL (CAAX protease family)
VSPAGPAREIAFVYVLTAIVTLVVSHTPGSLMSMYGHLLLAGTFLGTALTMARKDPRGARFYGIDLAGVLEAPPEHDAGLWLSLRRGLPGLLRELGFALLAALLVFPPFVLGFQLWHQVHQPFTFHPPSQPLDFVLTQLLAVALPEEALFRGYFQTRLADRFRTTHRVLGADVSLPALAWQAALFALLHFLVGFSPVRLAVFFPGLLFGFLRARRGGIGAAVWFHAFCNLLADVLTRGYL